MLLDVLSGFFFVPLNIWLAGIFMFTSLILGISLRAEHLKKEDLAKNIESQRDAARLLLDEINLRYNNAQLIKEIGQEHIQKCVRCKK